ncbi:MAG: haloacid dehalogenase-like hydrolase [Ardenticatenaceae bacterium]|nr:haloacid dehalogenase-like hydrolase [Ardenticatenaceae bacterium]
MSIDLSSWNDTATRQAIQDFVAKVTDLDNPAYVPPEERIAVFDNDGTLWCEKPMYIQLDFILRRWLEMVDENPDLAEEQPWKTAVAKDYAWLGNAVTKHYRGDDSDMPVLMKGILTAFADITVEEFATRAGEFLRTQSHPTLKRPYRQCGYAPMIELLHGLEANGFTNFIASGGGRDFMRPITAEMYGISPDRVIGSSVSLEFRANANGGDVLTKPQLDVLDDGPVKPIRIWSRIGRRPILAVGNSNGDVPMLQYTQGSAHTSLCLLVNHDDADREFAYAAGAEEALKTAQDRGWEIISMKQDWRHVFAG